MKLYHKTTEAEAMGLALGRGFSDTPAPLAGSRGGVTLTANPNSPAAGEGPAVLAVRLSCERQSIRPYAVGRGADRFWLVPAAILERFTIAVDRER